MMGFGTLVAGFGYHDVTGDPMGGGSAGGSEPS